MGAAITFVPVEADGRFQFHSADGSETVVDASGFETDDPTAIAFLDATPSVQREGGEPPAPAIDPEPVPEAEPEVDA